MEQPVKKKRTLWTFIKKYKGASLFLGTMLFAMLAGQIIFAAVNNFEVNTNIDNLVFQNVEVKQLLREDNMITLQYTFANKNQSVIVAYEFSGDPNSYGRFRLLFNREAIAIEDNARFLEPLFLGDAVLIRHFFPERENRFLIYNLEGEVIKDLGEFINNRETAASIIDVEIVQNKLDFEDVRIIILLDDHESITIRYLGNANFNLT